MSDQRFNTGNPIGSNSPLDRSDNTRNLDLAVQSLEDTFQDRMGRSRLTWAGIVKAGSGDAGVIVPIVQQAVQDVIAGVDGQVAVAQSAADRAETARDAAFVNADVYPDIATGRAAVAVGEQFQVLSPDGLDLIRYRKDSPSTQTEVARYPSKEFILNNVFAKLYPLSVGNINYVTSDRNLVFTGTVYLVKPSSAANIPAQTVNLPSNGLYRLEIDASTNLISAVLNNIQPTSGKIVLGEVRVTGSGISTLDFEHTVDGLSVGAESVSYTGVLDAHTDSDVNFDFDSDILTIGSARIRYNQGTDTVAPQTVSLPISTPNVHLVYNRATGIVRAITRTTAMTDGDILIGTYNKNLYLVHGIPLYRINGQPSETYTRGELFASRPSEVNFVFSENKLIIGGPDTVRVNRGNQITSLIAPQEVSLVEDSPAVQVLIFNPVTGMITSKPSFSPAYSYGDIQIGSYISRSGIVFGIPYYAINDVDASPTRTPLTQAYITVVNGVTDASYVQPALSGFEWVTGADHKDMYALYDDLVDEYPEYVTRTLMGQDTIGNDLFRYDFKPPTFHTESAGYPGTAKMILVTGVHGYEKAGIYATYSAMKEICTRWQDDERLETLRWGVHFIVVPVASPYGFDNDTRANERGVDMERNFPTGWDAGISDPESGQYRGPSPLSEPVVGYIDEILSQNTDALYYCSFHNMQNADYFIWNASATRFGIQAAQRLSSRLTVAWDKRYTRTSADGYIGYSDLTTPLGSGPMHAANRYNIQSGSFEISRRAEMYGENILWGPMVATLGTETFINWLLINLEYGAQLKNSSVRVAGQ